MECSCHFKYNFSDLIDINQEVLNKKIDELIELQDQHNF
jgi:hypothetical protein